MTDVLSHVRDGVNEARRLLPIKKAAKVSN